MQKKKKETSWMNKHIVRDHEGEEGQVEFGWKVTGKFKRPLQRQVSEAYNINKKKAVENLNSKKEFNGQNIRRWRIDNDITLCR